MTRGEQSGEIEIPWIKDSKVYEFRLYAASQPNAPIDSVEVRRDFESVPIILRELAEEATRGNIGTEELSQFIATVILHCLQSGRFDFAVNAAMSYQLGAARGIFSILSAMGISRDEFFSHIGCSINSLVLKHRCDLDRTRLITAVQRILKEEGLYLGEVTGQLDAGTSAALRQYGISDEANALLYSELVDSLRTAASDSEHKTRWVDQTPEYSFHICSLRKLFPCAVFVHIVRDVSSVVRSMLNFHRVGGVQLVSNQQVPYDW